MNIQFLATDDSDGDSWLEVLEGSPGPSLRTSSPSEPLTSSESSLFELVVAESDPERDEQHEVENTAFECDVESHPQQPTEEHTTSIETQPPHQIPLEKPLRLDRPEKGDIVRHFHEAYGKCLSQPDKADYYRTWLCCMYRMAWNQIWLLVFRAPDCVVHAANYLFGLRNHPFWSDGKGWRRERQQAMRAACCDILTWWRENRLVGEPRRDSSNTGDGCYNSARRAVAHSLEVELYYSSLSPPGEEEIVESTSETDRTGSACVTPWPPQQVINYVTNMYHSFDSRSYNEVDSYEISFDTWIDWTQHICRNRI